MTLPRFQRLLCLAFLWLFHSACLSAPADGEKMMEVLLRPTGWSADWSGPGGSGVTEVIFERRSDKIFAKINLIRPIEIAMTCESPVMVEASSITFDGCRDPNLTLNFNPSDSEFPFRGRTPRGYEWKLKAK